MEADTSAKLREALTKMQSTLSVSDVPEESFDYRADAVETSWDLSNVTPRYANVPPFAGKVGWSYLCGQVGSGKTHLATSMARKYLEENTYKTNGPLWIAPKVKIVTSPAYLEAIKDTYSHSGDYKIELYKTCDLLVLDDLGQEAPTSWACEQIFTLVNDRYNRSLPMIVTSQFPLDVLARRLSRNGGREQAEAIASRLMGMCTCYQLDGGDRRVSDAA